MTTPSNSDRSNDKQELNSISEVPHEELENKAHPEKSSEEIQEGQITNSLI